MPLDEATSTFYVKNSSQQVARTTLAVVNSDNTKTFESALTFAVHIDGITSNSTMPAPGTRGCSLITTGPSIEPGAVQTVDLALAVADLQDKSA